MLFQNFLLLLHHHDHELLATLLLSLSQSFTEHSFFIDFPDLIADLADFCQEEIQSLPQDVRGILWVLRLILVNDLSVKRLFELLDQE